MRFLLFLINIKVCFLATANNDYFLVIKSPKINSLFYEVHKFPHKLYIHFYYCKIKTWGKYISRWHFEGYTSFKICEGHLNSSLESKLIPSIATGKGIEETWFWTQCHSHLRVSTLLERFSNMLSLLYLRNEEYFFSIMRWWNTVGWSNPINCHFLFLLENAIGM